MANSKYVIIRSTYDTLEFTLDVLNNAELDIVEIVQDYRGNLKLIVEDKK